LIFGLRQSKFLTRRTQIHDHVRTRSTFRQCRSHVLNRHLREFPNPRLDAVHSLVIPVVRSLSAYGPEPMHVLDAIGTDLASH
jgi:hypothetical protein